MNMARPLIGYPSRSGLITTEPAGSTVPRFANNESYAYAIAAAGGAPLMIPSIPDDDVLASIYTALDGLLLTGGPDVVPTRYGQERHPLTDGGDDRMEYAEDYLARRALDDGLPILGICRGQQMLAVVAGGTLHQHVTDAVDGGIAHPDYLHPRDYPCHTVRVEPDSRLAHVVGRQDVPVNSLHHQAICTLPPSLRAVAVAPDGVIEAIERPGAPFVVAVQWHPEELYRERTDQAALFRVFVDAAASYRREREGRQGRQERGA